MLKSKTLQPTKIMVFGTFDVLHKGHLHFFKQARKLAKNPYLIVSIARSTNVKNIKGKKPLLNSGLRLSAVKLCPLVDRAVMGAVKDYISHILKEDPDIIALGYDQDSYTKDLQKKLAVKGLKVKLVRLLPHKPHVYKSSIVKKKGLML